MALSLQGLLGRRPPGRSVFAFARHREGGCGFAFEGDEVPVDGGSGETSGASALTDLLGDREVLACVVAVPEGVGGGGAELQTSSRHQRTRRRVERDLPRARRDPHRARRSWRLCCGLTRHRDRRPLDQPSIALTSDRHAVLGGLCLLNRRRSGAAFWAASRLGSSGLRGRIGDELWSRYIAAVT